MKRGTRISMLVMAHWLLTMLISMVVLAAFSKPAMAQHTTDPQVEDAFYVCLRGKVPGTERDPSDHTRAFDPNTGRNFVYDKDKKAWIDAKTGEVVCPKSAAEVEDAFYVCLRGKVPGTERDPGDHTRAFDPNTGRNFVYDKDKGAWIDAKTGECLCPKCPPPAAETTSAKPSEEPKKVEEKKEPSWWESLIPALIPSIGIGVGRERERRQPSNPCAGK